VGDGRKVSLAIPAVGQRQLWKSATLRAFTPAPPSRPWSRFVHFRKGDVGHETVLHRPDGAGLPAWQEAIFAAMERNSAHVSDFFNLPRNNVVEIGRQVEI